jgi:hypothetical protein
MVNFVIPIVSLLAAIKNVSSMGCTSETSTQASDRYLALGMNNFVDFAGDTTLAVDGSAFDLGETGSFNKNKNAIRWAHIYTNGKIRLSSKPEVNAKEKKPMVLLPWYDPVTVAGNVFYGCTNDADLVRSYKGLYFKADRVCRFTYVGMSDGETCVNGLGNNFQVLLLTRKTTGVDKRKTVVVIKYGKMSYESTWDGKFPLVGAMTNGNMNAFSAGNLENMVQISSPELTINFQSGASRAFGDLSWKAIETTTVERGDRWTYRGINTCGATGPCRCKPLMTDDRFTYWPQQGYTVEDTFHWGGLGCTGAPGGPGDSPQCKITLKTTDTSWSSIFFKEDGGALKVGSNFDCVRASNGRFEWLQRKIAQVPSQKKLKPIGPIDIVATTYCPSVMGLTSYMMKKKSGAITNININDDRNLMWVCKKHNAITWSAVTDPSIKMVPGEKCKLKCQYDDPNDAKAYDLGGFKGSPTYVQCGSWKKPEDYTRYSLVKKLTNFFADKKRKHFFNKDTLMQDGRNVNDGYRCVDHSH